MRISHATSPNRRQSGITPLGVLLFISAFIFVLFLILFASSYHYLAICCRPARNFVGWDKAASAAAGPPRRLESVGRRSLRELVPPYVRLWAQPVSLYRGAIRPGFAKVGGTRLVYQVDTTGRFVNVDRQALVVALKRRLHPRETAGVQELRWFQLLLAD